MDVQQLFGRINVEVLDDDVDKIRLILGQHGYKPLEKVTLMPQEWREEIVPDIDYIPNGGAREQLQILKSEGVEWTSIRLWHSPNEGKQKPETPDDVEIDWSNIAKVLGVVAGAVVTTVTFCMMAVGFLLVALIAGIDPWVVIELPSGTLLKVYEYEEA